MSASTQSGEESGLDYYYKFDFLLNNHASFVDCLDYLAEFYGIQTI